MPLCNQRQRQNSCRVTEVEYFFISLLPKLNSSHFKNVEKTLFLFLYFIFFALHACWNELKDLRLFDNFHQALSVIAGMKLFLTFLQLTVQQLLANLTKTDPRALVLFFFFFWFMDTFKRSKMQILVSPLVLRQEKKIRKKNSFCVFI